MKPILSLTLLSLALSCANVSAAPLRLAQATAMEPPAQGSPEKPKPVKKKPKPAAATGDAPTFETKKDADYRKTLQAPRRITKEDLEDDPSAPDAARLRPMLTPEGRPAMGGRF